MQVDDAFAIKWFSSSLTVHSTNPTVRPLCTTPPSGVNCACHRVIYSLSQILVTRSDSGEGQFNYSEIVGNAIAAGILNVYHPPDQRTLGHTVSVWGTDVMLNALCNVAKEFWPDIRRKIHKQKKSD